MDADFWLARWELGQIGFHLDGVHPLLGEYWARVAGGEPAPVFVPLCGKSHDLAWLASHGHAVIGCELSEQAVRSFFAEQGMQAEVTEAGRGALWRSGNIDVWCADFFDLEPQVLSGVQLFYDRASLIALPPPMRPRYVRQLQRLLPAGTRGLLITLDYPQAEMDGPPFSVDEAEVRALFEPGFEVEALASLDVLADHPGFRNRGLSALRERVYGLRCRRHPAP